MPAPRHCSRCDFKTADAAIRYCPNCGASLRAPIEFYDAFVSYRREGGSELAELVRLSIQTQYGMNLFVDVNELRAGAFDEKLLAIIENAPCFLLILSKGSLDRCQNEGDWLRREISHALKHGKRIVPVLAKGFVMPPAESLPEDIRKLTTMNGVPYDHQFREAAIAKIGGFIRDGAPPAPIPKPLALGPKPISRWLWTAAAIVSAVLALSVAGYRFGLKLRNEHERAAALAAAAHEITIPNLNLTMMPIAPGSFQMGSASGNDERPVTRVTISQPFWLGKTEITQAQWEAVMGNNPSHFKGADHPVECVNYDDAMEFCRKLTAWERAEGRLPEGYAYTLPTEAQWEYACRAGTTTAYWWGEEFQLGVCNVENEARSGWDRSLYSSDVINSAPKRNIATFRQRGLPLEGTVPVGSFEPNRWGLHDMAGNVAEWCSDWYGSYYPGGNVTDPSGAATGSSRVTRGGSWQDTGDGCRSANRASLEPNETRLPHSRYLHLGFRLALSAVR